MPAISPPAKRSRPLSGAEHLLLSREIARHGGEILIGVRGEQRRLVGIVAAHPGLEVEQGLVKVGLCLPACARDRAGAQKPTEMALGAHSRRRNPFSGAL